MLLNALEVEKLLQTNGKGAKAQVGFDLTVKGIKKISGGVVMADKTAVDPYIEITPTKNANDKLIFKLEPGTYSLTFEQGIKLPTNRTAFIRHRSSVLRCGGIITSGVYDPGFEVDEMGGVLIATQPIIIEKGARVAQIIMFQNMTAEAYNGQWQKEKDLK
jgi:deoxycytidine triphosphate deaminase